MKPSRSSLLALVTVSIVATSSAIAGVRKVHEAAGVAFAVSDAPDWCKPRLPLAAVARDASALSSENPAFLSALERARSLVQAECPAVTAILVDARVIEKRGEQPKQLYKTFISNADGWALNGKPSAPPTANQPRTDEQASAPGKANIEQKPTVLAEQPPSRPSTASKSNSAPAATKPKTPVMECDALASHIDDPEAFAPGISDENLDSKTAITACEAAIKQDSSAPRLRFQLARAYIKADRLEEAIELLISAAKQGHGASLAYLADIYLDGGPGIEPDPTTAHALYQKALASGFEPARKVLAEFEDYTDRSNAADAEESQLAKSGGQSSFKIPTFVNADIMANIEKGTFDSIKADELFTKKYLLHVAETLAEECDAHFSNAELANLRERYEEIDRIPGRLRGGMSYATTTAGQWMDLKSNIGKGLNLFKAMGNLSGYLDEVAAMKVAEEYAVIDGMKDGFTILLKHGCKSPALTAVEQNMKAFLQNKDASWLKLEAQDKVCAESAVKSGQGDAGKSACQCLVNAHAMNFISRGERKALYQDYWGYSQKLTLKQPDRYVDCRKLY